MTDRKPPSPSRFRSTLLQPMPQMRAWGNKKRVAQRMTWVLSTLALVIGFIFLVINRAFPPYGVWYVIYWLHDFIFLGLKGLTYTWFYPYSLIWYSILIIGLLLIISSYLLDRSFMLGPHILLLRFLVHLPPVHPILLRATRWLKRAGIKSELLRLTIKSERELLALSLFSEQDTGKRRRSCYEISTITALWVHIEGVFARWSSIPLAELWEEAFLLNLLSFNQESIKEKELCQKNLQTLITAFPDLFLDMGVKSNSWLCSSSFTHPFESDSLLRDLARTTWLSLTNAKERAYLFSQCFTDSEEDSKISSGLFLKLVVRSTDNRRFLLETILDDLSKKGQSMINRYKAVNGIGDSHRIRTFIQQKNGLPNSPSLNPDQFITGVSDGANLSILLAFHVALLAKNEECGLAFYDAFDALAISLAIRRNIKTNDDQGKDFLDNLFDGIPTGKHALLAAQFQAFHYARFHQIVLNLADFENSPVTRKDIFWQQELETIYRQAGGPICETDHSTNEKLNSTVKESTAKAGKKVRR